MNEERNRQLEEIMNQLSSEEKTGDVQPTRVIPTLRQKAVEPESGKPTEEINEERESAEAAAHDKPGFWHGLGMALLSLLFMAAGVVCLCWLLIGVQAKIPVSGSSAPAGAAREKTAKAQLTARMDVFANNSASDALSDLVYIRKIYTIPEGDLAGPAPNPACYGHTTDPMVVQAVVDSAAELLDGQELFWNPELNFMSGKDIAYYYDETILAICWKEAIDGCCANYCEVKIADGSQLRRTIAGNSYGSSVQLTASEMAKASNAVVAINGDFYGYRKLGITAYQRQLYRNLPEKVDSCFFTAGGDMLFSHRGELMGEGEAEKFIEDNDVIFAIAFGPILVENGELKETFSYPLGEINKQYSRAAIGQIDKLHYILMTNSFQDYLSSMPTINGAAALIYRTGVKNAYALDGGQTGVLYIDGGPFNHVDFGWERLMSDIIYFATAIPEEEAGQ